MSKSVPKPQCQAHPRPCLSASSFQLLLSTYRSFWTLICLWFFIFSNPTSVPLIYSGGPNILSCSGRSHVAPVERHPGATVTPSPAPLGSGHAATTASPASPEAPPAELEGLGPRLASPSVATGKGAPASAPACGHLRPASRRHRRRPFKVTPTGNNVLVFTIFLRDVQ